MIIVSVACFVYFSEIVVDCYEFLTGRVMRHGVFYGKCWILVLVLKF